MITLQNLLEFGLFVIGLVGLCYEIFKDKKKDDCHYPHNSSHPDKM